MSFDAFLDQSGPALRAALIAAYGHQVGADAVAAAIAYGWEHWARVGKMNNPAGYLYRVGQTAAKSAFRPQPFLPVPPPQELPEFEPGLLPALESLTEPQRVSVLLVHALGYTQVEAAQLLDVSKSTIRTHLARGLKKLRSSLEGESHV